MKGLLFFLLLFCSPLMVEGQELEEPQTIAIGKIIELESKILGEKRRIYVYQPQGFWGMDENMNNLPVIYVLDGESQFTHTATAVDFLSAAPNGNDLIPRSIVVGIVNTNRMRHRCSEGRQSLIHTHVLIGIVMLNL